MHGYESAVERSSGQMPYASEENPNATVDIPRVEVMRAGSVALLCLIGARLVWIPYPEILPGSQVGPSDRRGSLRLPRRTARALGLLPR